MAYYRYNVMQILKSVERSLIINKDYYNAIPRPTKEEYTALKMSIIEKGQLEPITVNKNLTILDGHTRYDIMYERGMEISYDIKEFDSEELERKYVIESNIIRRHMTDFQKVEAVSSFYFNLVEKRNREKKFNKYIDILEVMTKPQMNISEISTALGKHDNYIRSVLRQMSDEFLVRIEKIGFSNLYSRLPKSEEIISKERVKDGISLEIVGATIGVSKANVQRSNYLLKKADKRMLVKLRNGTITISTAYELLTNGRRFRPRNHISKNTKFKCPHCESIHRMEEYDIIDKV